jgi:malate synthase
MNNMPLETKGIQIIGEIRPSYEEILTPDALQFNERIEGHFGERRLKLLKQREAFQGVNQGVLPDFLIETKSIRDGDWKVGEIPADLLDRRVEITGPVDRKMIINTLNSGANLCFHG